MAAFDAEAVFKQQQEACTKFFRDNLPKDVLTPMQEEEKPENTKKFKGPVYDITGFDAENVVALLSDIVNNKEQFKTNKTFYLLLQNSHDAQPDDEIEELFRLKARPKPNQPGNGIVFLRPRGNKTFTRDAKKYDELHGALKAHYNKDTKSFAKDIKNLFQNNSVVTGNIPQATFEAYMILLFEIARRLVTVDEPSKEKKEYDVLPIGSAIARSVKLLEEEKCTFDDVFLSEEKEEKEKKKKKKKKEKISIATRKVPKKGGKQSTISTRPQTRKVITSKSLKTCSAQVKKCLLKNWRI